MRYEAHTHQNFHERGMTNVVVARTDDAGWVHAGGFLVDLWCLGVKNAFITECSASAWPATLDRIVAPAERLALHPACARKMVEGAVAYAEALGFSPHRDFNKARRVFGSIAARDCPENFACGKDGKPFFFAGPNDDRERIGRIMRVLTAKLGPKGFHYLSPIGLSADTDDDVEDDDEGTPRAS